ncbi:MAG: cation-translocating P-type ATPase [Hyphomonadaceae bacterium]|nr:cation-translocating P-type ATPase [Hyphomonadaceae bacterium]
MADDSLTGLSVAQAEALLKTHGPNTLRTVRSRNLLTIALATLREPMFIFLLVAASLYLLVGDLGEGLFLLGGAAVSVALVVFQDARSERALAALRQLAEPFADVIRDGSQQRIPARDLVPGDIILVKEGERISADAVFRKGDILTVDESALTGESVALVKQPGPWHSNETDEDAHAGNALFAGTMLLAGQGLAQVTQTGPRTRIGAIGSALSGEMERTPLQETTGRLVLRLGVIAVVFCLLVAAAYGFIRGDWFAGGLAGLTIAISLLPEEFPMVLAVFLAIGSWRLARHQVLVRRSAVVETLGAMTMLCVDKTGTLTENRMKIGAIWANAEQLGVDMDSAAGDVARVALLASAVHPVDPMDRAVCEALGSRAASLLTSYGGEPVSSFPLRPDRLAVIQSWSTDAGTVWASKGAPEAILRLCKTPLAEQRLVEAALAGMAASGLRVLGVAKADDPNKAIGDPKDAPFEFVGLIGFLDPLRTDVPAALAEARAAGIDVSMITGDYPATALEIARQAGLDITGGVLTGAEIAALSPQELSHRLATVRIFARVKPQQKLALVEAFKARSEVVAMTGDGINDAPALERAHIGIAMGKRGTDVAREAADLVLLDDSFPAIVGGVRLGRRIFTNLRKALIYVMAVHVPIAGVSLLPILFGLPPLLYPMHVVMLELIIDPVCSLVFESEPSDRSAMLRPPRSIKEPLFGKPQMMLAIVQGAVLLTAVLGIYVWALHNGLSENQARAAGFMVLVIGNLVLALANASGSATQLFDPRHNIFWGVGAVAVVVLVGTLTIPFLSEIFRVEAPDGAIIALCVMTAVIAGGWYGIARRWNLHDQAEHTQAAASLTREKHLAPRSRN